MSKYELTNVEISHHRSCTEKTTENNLIYASPGSKASANYSKEKGEKKNSKKLIQLEKYN